MNVGNIEETSVASKVRQGERCAKGEKEPNKERVFVGLLRDWLLSQLLELRLAIKLVMSALRNKRDCSKR